MCSRYLESNCEVSFISRKWEESLSQTSQVSCSKEPAVLGKKLSRPYARWRIFIWLEINNKNLFPWKNANEKEKALGWSWHSIGQGAKKVHLSIKVCTANLLGAQHVKQMWLLLFLPAFGALTMARRCSSGLPLLPLQGACDASFYLISCRSSLSC